MSVAAGKKAVNDTGNAMNALSIIKQVSMNHIAKGKSIERQRKAAKGGEGHR